MKKDKKAQDEKKTVEQNSFQTQKEQNMEKCSGCSCAEASEESNESRYEDLDARKTQLEDKSKQCDEYLDKLQRTAAEFDNYKKRTAREKEAVYSDAVSDVVLAFLPIIDNLDRALQVSANDENAQSLREGVEMVSRQMKDAMMKFGVEEIQSVGEAFSPELHNAVMHIEDDAYGENIIVEEFQKGYVLKEKVIRYSMVKVAN
jgi:molecular chaperone GrpE